MGIIINKKCHFDRARAGMSYGAKEKSLPPCTLKNACEELVGDLSLELLDGKDLSLVPRSKRQA